MRAAVLVLLLAAVTSVIVYRSWIDAQAHAVGLLALALKVPVLARLTVTSTLDHAIPSLSLSDIADLFRFNGWAVRLMHTLRANRLAHAS